ncbi:immunity 22 family protein [Pedobacter miscanthi]|uniref:Uncharacterized protein n=1 Tax=Pedobacter miscanthi TaxID=2259170 RepID=A0A366L064_9SPHI|nr:immunity 22 family protein [Pedobacter miscanthi]RBQ06694.1 hypothetical protein DRW42_12985 [Pedobacter miscanthi]
MKSIHLWAGQVASKALLEAYLDQRIYLKAWAKYDNEPPTGNPEEDAEPSPNLMCGFCKDTGIDIYDEDMMVLRYYTRQADLDKIAKDISADAAQLGKLLRKNKIENFNAVIAYDDNSLKPKKSPYPTLFKYLGKLSDSETSTGSKTQTSHYLWTGDVQLSKAEIIKRTGLKSKEISDLKFFFSKEKKRIDETIILGSADLDLAEQLILKVDSLGISQTANAILMLSLNSSIQINIEKISKNLHMDFIARQN